MNKLTTIQPAMDDAACWSLHPASIMCTHHLGRVQHQGYRHTASNKREPRSGQKRMMDDTSSSESLDHFPHSYTLKNHELDYVTTALESTTKTQDAHARRAAGIKDPRFIVRLVKRLQHAQLGVHARKPGPPSKYTDEVFEKALDVCREHAVIN